MFLSYFNFPSVNPRKAGKPSLRVEGVCSVSQRNLIPSHCWPMLTPPPRDPPLLQHYANLCCALNRCPNNSLSAGGGGSRALARKERCYFHGRGLITIQLRTSIWADSGFRHVLSNSDFPGFVRKKR